MCGISCQVRHILEPSNRYAKGKHDAREQPHRRWQITPVRSPIGYMRKQQDVDDETAHGDDAEGSPKTESF